MAYVYDGEGYRGGAAGLQADIDLRQYYAQQAANALTSGQGYATADQIERSKRELDPAVGAYHHMMLNGLYSPDEMQALESAKVQQVNNATRALQQNVNATLAQRGAAGNAGAGAALSMAGQFKGAGERGQTRADIIAANKAAQVAGLSGFADMQKAQASLSAQPTRMDVNENDYSALYDQWRNEQVGYDGADFGTEPEQPDFYSEEEEGSKKKQGFGGRGAHTISMGYKVGY